MQGIRSRHRVDQGTLELLLVRFSQLVVEQKWIKDVNINPLLASSRAADRGIDARVIVHGLDARVCDLPRPAIRQYPSQYITTWTDEDGTQVVILGQSAPRTSHCWSSFTVHFPSVV